MKIPSAAIALSLLFAVGLVGCNNNGPQDTPAEKESADRMHQIRQKTNGDWNKLTADDKTWLLAQVGGNENSAKMLLTPPGGGHVGPPGQRK